MEEKQAKKIEYLQEVVIVLSIEVALSFIIFVIAIGLYCKFRRTRVTPDVANLAVESMKETELTNT
jgi:hypothetical protein